MSEDAPVNTGAVEWPHPDAAYFAVRRMQTKLHRWAGEDASRRFGDLHNLIYDPAFLVHVWERVSSNAGARTPGVDKATVAWIEARIGVVTFLGHIRDALKAGEFQPVHVRQVMIPKASGKLRKLGIPTVADRVVQTSLKLVLEPIFEADFLPCSYGFRPNRRAHDAIAEIHHLASEPINYRWVLEADIAACFDEIGHTPLLGRIRRRIKDKRVCALVKAFLKAGVMTTNGDREETTTGTPQGGPLSPLLANIALSELDEHFHRQWQQEMGTQSQRAKRVRNGLGNWRLIRFADDFVVMVFGERRHAEALREEVAAVLAPLGLRLSPEKTRVVHIDEGFDFLGMHIRRQRKRGTQKYYVYTKPSRKAIQAIKDKVKARTYRSTRHMGLDEVITSLNRLLAGSLGVPGLLHDVAVKRFTESFCNTSAMCGARCRRCSEACPRRTCNMCNTLTMVGDELTQPRPARSAGSRAMPVLHPERTGGGRTTSGTECPRTCSARSTATPGRG